MINVLYEKYSVKGKATTTATYFATRPGAYFSGLVRHLFASSLVVCTTCGAPMPHYVMAHTLWGLLGWPEASVGTDALASERKFLAHVASHESSLEAVGPNWAATFDRFATLPL